MVEVDVVGIEKSTANDAPPESLSQPQTEELKMEPKTVERYFNLLELFI